MNPTVSIIIPAYNEAERLPLCLQSIQDLDWPREQLEVIVVDNGSTDTTCEIARSFNAVLLQDDTRNVSGLRNLGARQARGEILAFVDADCMVSPNWLKCAFRYFEDPTAAAWGSPPEIPDNPTWVQAAWRLVRVPAEPVGTVDWLESMNLFVRKPLFELVGGFNESLETCEDVDFCFRIADHGHIVSDRAIQVIHLGEAASLKIFFKKELWRGKSSFSGVFSHGLRIGELPSLAVPIYFGVWVPVVLAWSLFQAGGTGLAAAIAVTIFPGAAVWYRYRNRPAGWKTKLQLLVLMYVYFLARTLAVVKPGK